ncbi:hypothetical protein T484DRAFT_1802658, partial [Baffinella frigidus]
MAPAAPAEEKPVVEEAAAAEEKPAAAAAEEKPAEAAKKEPQTMSVGELKAELLAGGRSTAGMVEKADLIAGVTALRAAPPRAARTIYPKGAEEPCRKCLAKGIDFKCKASEWRAHAAVEHPREGDMADKKAADNREECEFCGKRNHVKATCWRYMEENNIELTEEQKATKEAIMTDGGDKKKRKKRKSTDIDGDVEGDGPSPEKAQKTTPAAGDKDKKKPAHEKKEKQAFDKNPKFFKLLMPSKDMGTIIGKAGATIKLIQSKSGARVKVSNATDFSPWAEARVVLISGQTTKIGKAIANVLQE